MDQLIFGGDAVVRSVVRLVEGVLTIEPAGKPGQAAEMPRVARSVVAGLMTVSDLFYKKHGRCMAAVLLLNMTNGLCGVELPRQTCGKDRATWSLDLAAAGAEEVRYVLAGSFQVATADVAVADLVPAFDGIHIIRRFSQTQEFLSAAVVVEGNRRFVSYLDAIRDDYQETLDAAAERMTIA